MSISLISQVANFLAVLYYSPGFDILKDDVNSSSNTMNILKKRLLGAVALAPFFLSQPVLAHVIWFERINHNQHEILFGHPA